MSVLEFEDEDEVIARANATEFGLAAAVFTQRCDAGSPSHRAPAGRNLLDQSLQHHADRAAVRWHEGLGARARERQAAIEHYSQLKSVYVAMADVDSPY